MSDPKIIHCRICNGDEIIGELAGSNKDEVFILKPMLVSEITDEKTQISTIVLSKYVLFDDNTAIHFKKIHIITQTDILDEIKAYYTNSIVYNTKFIEPIVRAELTKVNAVMANILAQSELMEKIISRRKHFTETIPEMEPLDKDVKIIVPCSNSVH